MGFDGLNLNRDGVENAGFLKYFVISSQFPPLSHVSSQPALLHARAMTDSPTVRLFAYGTLQQREVQIATCGRPLDGTSDMLGGYRLEPLAITAPEVVQLSGKAVHTIARGSGDPADRIPGVVFQLTEAELAAADRYEVDAYARVEAMLQSGTRAFVYVGPGL